MNKLVCISAALALSSCGPGVTDGVFDISGADGYALCDTGGNGKSIVFKGPKQGFWEFVIGERVDGYLVRGTSLYVARRKRSLDASSGVVVESIDSRCTFYRIDIPKKLVIQLKEGEASPVSCQ